jgi:two-component system chemotaxis response regulator CheY
MKIFLNDAEKNCIKELETLRSDIFGFRAVFVRLSSSANKSNNITRLLIAEANKLLEGNPASIFIFKDYDILIIYQGLSIKLTESIIKIISDVTGEDANKITRLYDLEKNSEVITSICSKKLELYDLEKKAQLQSEQEALNENAKINEPLTITLDKTLLETLSARKNSHTNTKILLVEDDAFSRRLVKNLLQKEYEVIEAESGKDALTKYITYAPNIVFLDINLPDSTGMQVLEQLVTMDKKSYVIMLSGNSFKDNILLSVKKGAKGFVAKPFPREKLFHYIEKYQQDKVSEK